MHSRLQLGAALCVALATSVGVAAPLPTLMTEIVKDRSTFIPQRKYEPLKGTMVGVVVGNVQAMMGQEGRGGPPDAFGFSRNGGSYRWMYVPVTEKALITNLSVRVGEEGAQRKVYPTLSMASPATLQQWNINTQVALVEVQVNDGMGAPAEEGFVATSMRRLDGSREFPAKLPEVVEEVRQRYATHVKDQQKVIETSLAEAQKKALMDRQPTGPRETKELFYITWLPEKDRYRIHFRTTITDGAYQFGNGANLDGPFPLPVPPMKEGPPPPARQPEAAQPARRPPPPPRPTGARFGSEFGIEYGAAFEVTASGKVDRLLVLPPQTFTRELPPPPAIRRPIDPLPPRPDVKKD